MGYSDIGCFGGKFAPTPNLDRLAQEGIRFTQYYSVSPICSPSRAGLTTGMFPARWNITSFLQTRAGNRGCEQADFLDPRAPSLARTLKAAGYATGHFGKWHMGGGRDVTNAPPFAAYGFDEHAGTWESPQPHPDITSTNWIWCPNDKVKRWDRTAFFVDKTLDFLRRHKGQPCYRERLAGRRAHALGAEPGTAGPLSQRPGRRTEIPRRARRIRPPDGPSIQGPGGTRPGGADVGGFRQ